MENNQCDSSNSLGSKTILICPAIVAVCEEFAAKRLEDSKDLYKLRGEDKVEKIRQDIITGAMAEFAVYDYLTAKGYECSKPDLAIYQQRQKSYSPDLVCDGKVIHVKSQTVESAAKYGASWLFQVTDKVLAVPSENSLMIFCLVNGTSVEIKAIVRVLDIVENELTAKPKVWKYATSKLAIYLADVLKSTINQWRL